MGDYSCAVLDLQQVLINAVCIYWVTGVPLANGVSNSDRHSAGGAEVPMKKRSRAFSIAKALGEAENNAEHVKDLPGDEVIGAQDEQEWRKSEEELERTVCSPSSALTTH